MLDTWDIWLEKNGFQYEMGWFWANGQDLTLDESNDLYYNYYLKGKNLDVEGGYIE